MSDMDDLQASVTASDNAVDSAITLLQGISSAMANAGTDGSKLRALRADIDAKTQQLAQAVVANTPAAVGSNAASGLQVGQQPGAASAGGATGADAGKAVS